MDRTSQNGAADRGQNEVADNGAETPSGTRAWKRCAGAWRDNPDFDDLLKQLEEIRREADEAAGEP